MLCILVSPPAEVGASNCKQPYITTNSATEFDAEVFRTDIRKLSQEFPVLADDSNPAQDDIRDFLPELVTTSHKARGKRKRKIPKLLQRTNKNFPISHPPLEPQTSASTTEDHKASMLPNPH
ncbi:hypothetical protein ACTXT7_004128 [Hymenolepis weldensis]